MKINWRFVLSRSWWALLFGALIAVGIAFFPQAQCVVAGTCNQPRDLWCNNGKPGKCCLGTNGFEVVTSCQKVGNVCKENTITVAVSCSNASDCNVTRVLNSKYKNRLSGGYWYVGSCPSYYPVRGSCGVPKTDTNKERATCCGGASIENNRTCTPQYAPPTIDDTYMVFPPNPVVWTQEQPPYGEALGLTINDIKAHGGTDTSCGTGGQANITSVTITLTLTQKSIDWILNELAQRYINVTIKDTYPKQPERPDPTHPSYSCSFSPLTGASTPNAELDCQFFRPLDPGEYAINVTACQSDGKCTTKTLPQPVKVWLLESTLTVP